MRETAEEVQRLQALMDATNARANAHMAAIVKPERQLNAAQMVKYLQGLEHVAFGTVNAQWRAARGAARRALCPRPLHAQYRARMARWRNLERNPACSAAHYVGDDVAVVVNGHVDELTRDHPDHDEVHDVWYSHYESSPYSWGDVVIFRVEPVSMWAYAMKPADYPE